MRRILIALFVIICEVSFGQIWQPADPTGVIYFEPTTGTSITISPSAITVTTNAQYTGVYTPVKLEITAYDSIGHFDGRRTVMLPCTDTEICKRIHNYTTTISGEFVFTVFGTPEYQSSHLISYSIIIFTYKAQKQYEKYLKSIYR